MAEPVVIADAPLDKSPTLTIRLVAEVFGTFVLVFSVIGTAIFASSNTGWLGVAFAAGIAVLAAAYAVGHISGGHFNPAVTFAAASSGRFAWRDVFPYIIAQIVGGLLATLVLFLVHANVPTSDAIGTFAGASNGFGAEGSPIGASLVAVILVELVATFLFTVIILGVTDRRAPTGFAPLAIGLALVIGHLVAIPVSNASLNPARSIATAVFGGAVPLTQLWVFILVPLVAGLLGGLFYRGVLEAKKA